MGFPLHEDVSIRDRWRQADETDNGRHIARLQHFTLTLPSSVEGEGSLPKAYAPWGGLAIVTAVYLPRSRSASNRCAIN